MKNGIHDETVDWDALANLRYRIRKFRHFSAREALKLGLAPQEHQALLAIKGHGKAMTLAVLGERLLLDRKAVGALVGGLAARELVFVETHGRQRLLSLCNAAETLLDRLSQAHLYEIREMAPDLMHALRVLQDRQKLSRIAWMQ